MKKKYLVILCVLGVMIVMSLTMGMSYAYYTMTRVSVNTSISGSTNVNLVMGPASTITFNVNPYLVSNGDIIAESNEVAMNVNLTNNGSSFLTCYYDIYYIPDSTSDTFVYSPGNTGGLQELAIVGNDGSGQNSNFSFNLANKPYVDENGYKIMTASASSSAGSGLSKFQWNFRVVYYNYDFDQSVNASKTIKGKISFVAKGCNNQHTALTLINSLVGSSNTDSNSQPWTVKKENYIDLANSYGTRYEGKNPDNYICFAGSCAASTLYRIVGIIDDEAYDGDSTLYTSKLLKVVKSTYQTTAAYGVSGNWNNSTLKTTLNGTYLTNAAITNVVSQILNTKWHLTTSSSVSLTPKGMYEAERGGVNTVGEYSFDKIGLLYGSDFLYSSYETGSCNHNDVYSATYATNCSGSTYLLPGGNSWFITPSSTALYVRYYTTSGTIASVPASDSYRYQPVFHLKSNIMLFGSGTSSDPYRIVE